MINSVYSNELKQRNNKKRIFIGSCDLKVLGHLTSDMAVSSCPSPGSAFLCVGGFVLSQGSLLAVLSQAWQLSEEESTQQLQQKSQNSLCLGQLGFIYFNLFQIKIDHRDMTINAMHDPGLDTGPKKDISGQLAKFEQYQYTRLQCCINGNFLILESFCGYVEY